MDVDAWSDETKAAYLACAIDTDGWISLRFTNRSDQTPRLTPSVGITNQSLEFLTRLAEVGDVPPRISRNGVKGRDVRGVVTRQDVWQTYWRSPPHVLRLLSVAEPYLVAKRQRALWVIEFCRSRIGPSGMVGRSGTPYTARSWELARLVTEANGRTLRLPEVPAGLA